MIEVKRYDSKKFGYRSCNVCFDNNSKNCILTEMVVGSDNGGMQIIM